MSETVEKPRILAVDDSRVMRRAMGKVLGKEYDVIEAEHGEDAWTFLLNEKGIQVVFTDLAMPYLDGFGLLERIRTSEEAHIKDLPVIILTGKEDDEETKQDALAKGATDFITKPFDSIQLQARAKSLINYNQTSSKLSETQTKLEKQSAVDETTGLGGQKYFSKAANETLAYSKRHKGQYVLLRMDIDNFDKVFITNGKPFAEAVLREVGKRLSAVVRQEDMLARVGLAKFAMLLRSTDMDDAMNLAERMRKELASLKFKSKDTVLQITVSIGLLEPLISEDATIEEQISETEKFLSAAVKAGGNKVVSHSQLESDGTTNQDIDLGTAMEWIEHGKEKQLLPYHVSIAAQVQKLVEYMVSQGDEKLRETLDAIKSKLS